MNDLKKQFLLDFSLTHLNHGSFGACPKFIFDDYQHWQPELEKSSVQFVTKTGVKFVPQKTYLFNRNACICT